MFVRILTLVALALALTGCNISDDQPISVGNNGGASDAGNNSGDGANGDTGATNSCTPASCGDDQCGMVDDGCGGSVDCGVCTCTDANFETFCPEMPCMTVSGCSATSECEYEPVSCGGQACACEDPANCTDDELRWCRDAAALTCPADACDPQPSANADGTMSYANVCGQPDGASCDYSDICIQGACAGTECLPADCGVCGLGHWDCDEAGGRTCLDIPDSATSNDAANCNDRSPDSTFVYVDDAAGMDAPGSGSKTQPFASLTAALQAAQMRGASALIVRSGYVHSGTLEVVDGVSIYSGYSGAPDWDYDDGFMNVDGDLTAVLAQQIAQRTVLHRVNIRSSSAGSGSALSSYGVRAIESGGLVLSQTRIQAGDGGSGASGRDGANGRNGGSAPRAPLAPAPGAPGTNSVCGSQANGGSGGRGGSSFQPGFPGAPSSDGISGGAGGGPGSDGRSGLSQPAVPGPGANGVGGVAGYTIANGLWVPNGKGGTGATAGAGSGGGGGGGGGGSDDLFRTESGGGGGGGGAGGCGGSGGEGGGPAGGSFGILAINSTGLQVIDSAISAGNGGNGGAPGVGGEGGAPGLGAAGSLASVSSGNGGRGGDGRPGGKGGVGGGGAGGDSVAIQCEATTLDPADLNLDLSVSNRGLGGVAPLRGEDGVAQPVRGCTP